MTVDWPLFLDILIIGFMIYLGIFGSLYLNDFFTTCLLIATLLPGVIVIIAFLMAFS